MFIINKNIKIPKKQGTTEFMKGLEVGDSFVIDLDKRAGLTQLAMQIGIKITTKKINEEEARVWRTL